MENLTRTALGTIAALVIALAIGGGVGALAFGGNDNKSGSGEASLDNATEVSESDLPFFVTNRPGGGYDVVPRPGYKLDRTSDTELHVINLNPPPDPPAKDEPKPPPVEEPKPEPPPPPPADDPKLPDQPHVDPPIEPQQTDDPPYQPSDPVIPKDDSKKKAPKGCKTKKQKKSKKCRPPKPRQH